MTLREFIDHTILVIYKDPYVGKYVYLVDRDYADNVVKSWSDHEIVDWENMEDWDSGRVEMVEFAPEDDWDKYCADDISQLNPYLDYEMRAFKNEYWSEGVSNQFILLIKP